ncbi:NADH-ubiquinone oxidoreductase chain 4L (mitochondrion) [Yarrowia sp. C11]|jgi:NADH-ubiquinone oxidoreductase chain 4L|uniref:NADH-ubiquinone oxidoreductase chain 4L n=4 Tax=Yarrowia lipolytica TaxID=4952 RepID=NU4LM_YARLI|nr:ND4L protein [Yarrowia lipolytica]Q9B6D4.1 RecName: Full=NADH-ubiquinone oxidoreductase chain 4L; AltName: Full=NADH dehydrogenase subunit 4L [Yarrowia lipolytica CLIB122]4WZ7_L Chain L, NADH-ubiquinone oxidoreductase chain 4L [Yarrowia lipolytica]6RFQ_L Chain L, Subunit NULM of NADH:Ubiquinone Oxidoreductase (Complex I) [Yarrowia lipolytica]6RFR_L Chain L, Subunit NULM of NADH:Ubiquinone Oxidoreductase (Complex I) [Yarrowia lipolytica]6RFS_L Chain L, Subunit NULM of NADH:Ubiquinone Oxidore|eukprot:NP_075439.2 ND4L protein (mitochondrion) [Yarrowia lipolytica]
MFIGTIILVLSFLGFVFNRRNIILAFICLETMLLGINLILLRNSVLFDDISGSLFAIVIIILAGVESAIGLSLLVSYYRLRGVINSYGI